MSTTVYNYEFEAKVFQDLACILGDGATCDQLGSYGQSEEFIELYSDFLIDVASNGGLTDVIIDTFNNLCSEWTGYSGTYDSSFYPEILTEFFLNDNDNN